MTKEKDTSLDILGIKPISEAANKLTDASVNGASAFLSRICLPAAEEFGLLLKDKVSGWRAKNAIKIAAKTQEFYEKQKLTGKKAHPRIVFESIEKGSWCEDEVLQSMWGGLLASSCHEKGNDDSNIIFTGLLSQMTSLQVKILNFSCEKATKYIGDSGLPFAGDLIIQTIEVKEIFNIANLNRLDFEFDHLRKLELITTGFEMYTSERANLTPTPLALNLYVRCNGFSGSPQQFWNLEPKSKTEQVD